MKNIVRSISGSGFLISGTILIGTYPTFNYEFRLLGFILSLIFIIAGVILSISANGDSATGTDDENK